MPRTIKNVSPAASAPIPAPAASGCCGLCRDVAPQLREGSNFDLGYTVMYSSYCIWNNKGGVGKTFLTYGIAIEYAKKHSDKNVVIFDLCPQANLSTMLLGGDGAGEENLALLSNNERTIANYIKQRYDRSRFGLIGREIGYFIKVAEYNKNLPGNIYLLPGDADLDLCAQLIDYMASAPEKNAWGKSRQYVLELLSVFNDEHKTKDNCFFIDTNPSFANYTHLGILAANRLIIPCTADSFPMRGIYNIFRLLYGAKIQKKSPPILSDDDIFTTFNERAEHDAGYALPQIHSFVLNRSRTFDKKASKAYKAHVQEINNLAITLSNEYPERFLELSGASERVHNLKDANTISTVLNYHGIAPSSLEHKPYLVYEEKTQVNQSQINPYLDDLKRIIDSL
ncbi:MAG: ParA family protein [Desulfobulbaceae bacterium]|jgi:cellulose biosynthesis protein BcsQ|nr:ParA family protein [Desulfobulbaceae bacterium]